MVSGVVSWGGSSGFNVTVTYHLSIINTRRVACWPWTHQPPKIRGCPVLELGARCGVVPTVHSPLGVTVHIVQCLLAAWKDELLQFRARNTLQHLWELDMPAEQAKPGRIPTLHNLLCPVCK